MFIELTDTQTNEKMMFNKNQIVSVWKCNEKTGIDTVIHNYGQSYFVKESYEEVKAKITVTTRTGFDEWIENGME